MIPLTHKIAAILAAVYGLISITGGTIGYIKAGSVPSLVAGGGAGVLLVVAAIGVFYQPTAGLIGAAVLAIALIGNFAPKVLNPSDLPEKQVGNIVAIVMAIGGIVVLVAAAIALFTGSSSSSS